MIRKEKDYNMRLARSENGIISLCVFFSAIMFLLGLYTLEFLNRSNSKSPDLPRQYAAPFLAVPPGCRTMHTRFGEELTKACDTPQTRLALPADFDAGLQQAKGAELFRIGNDLYSASCEKNWPGCEIYDSQLSFFFQPTDVQRKTLEMHQSRFRGSPVRLGPSQYGYPDMFPSRVVSPSH